MCPQPGVERPLAMRRQGFRRGEREFGSSELNKRSWPAAKADNFSCSTLPSRLECQTIGGPAAPNVVQACSAQAIASEARNLALLATLPSRQRLRGRCDGWHRVRMGATLPWPAPHSHRLYQLAAARNMRANFARSERKNSHYISEQAPSLH